MDVVGPFGLQSQELDVGLARGFGGDVSGHEEARRGVIDPAKPLSSPGLENPVIGMEAKSLTSYVSLAMCSKRTLLLRCLSRWRSLSSGVCMRWKLLIPAA